MQLFDNMKYKLLTLVLLLIPKVIFGQINAVVIDDSTKDIIPYVNIWIEDENTGTTSNENGAFSLDCEEQTKIVVFSAIGYETKKIKSGLINQVVELKPKITEIPEVVIKPTKQNEELSIGRFEKSGINYYFACGTKPWITARYFEFKADYYQTPFLNKIKLLTNSDVKDSKFNIRLYSVDENGNPGSYIYDKNIIGVAPKGKKITEIDISELNIRFPEKGLFVAIEWLIIESNKFEFNYTMNDSKKKFVGIRYAPSFGTIPSETDANSWIFSKGKWRKIEKNDSPIKNYQDKYNLLAIELILTN